MACERHGFNLTCGRHSGVHVDHPLLVGGGGAADKETPELLPQPSLASEYRRIESTTKKETPKQNKNHFSGPYALGSSLECPSARPPGSPAVGGCSHMLTSTLPPITHCCCPIEPAPGTAHFGGHWFSPNPYRAETFDTSRSIAVLLWEWVALSPSCCTSIQGPEGSQNPVR